MAESFSDRSTYTSESSLCAFQAHPRKGFRIYIDTEEASTGTRHYMSASNGTEGGKEEGRKRKKRSGG